VRLVPLQTEIVGNTAGVLWLLLGAVGLVLVVACANVALLSLMRGLDRSEDTALRRALGASSGRLMREFFLESMILSVLGGAFGVAIATAGLQILPALSLDLPRLSEVSLDYRALLFSAGVTTLSALLAGLPQAWRRSRPSPPIFWARRRRRPAAGGSIFFATPLSSHKWRWPWSCWPAQACWSAA
jgi:ABC-type antimicrobial peptide transport system permease subunit